MPAMQSSLTSDRYPSTLSLRLHGAGNPAETSGSKVADGAFGQWLR
ncbi:hypothetical protein OOK13_29870 [Streptomyces sp. NBC_00378]|nr:MULTISPECIES: hypothetical protein [unclassified Streptomyces]MCX5112600.1 hypothetical protein [Streptomyces sp. NBC_00378]